MARPSRYRKRAPAQKPRATPLTGGLFPEWVQAQIEKQADSPLAGLPERIKEMHKLYGATDGQTCKGCKYLHRYRQSTRWMKCHKSFQSSSTATDWRAKWPACGLYEKRDGDIRDHLLA